ncbi:hypothetical protein SAMN04488029_3816 [Reichenbachiella faecimaris]|uniref:Uncharacterized protein n=1 Tax=Reichenbachiella faecimaris TaxID=692418 RepID=A0A1W2GPR2_REIFA|nr:hypothetical protein SAMN04488029_3816 [Reichenbachiella faecimaris]
MNIQTEPFDTVLQTASRGTSSHWGVTHFSWLTLIYWRAFPKA